LGPRGHPITPWGGGGSPENKMTRGGKCLGKGYPEKGGKKVGSMRRSHNLQRGWVRRGVLKGQQAKPKKKQTRQTDLNGGNSLIMALYRVRASFCTGGGTLSGGPEQAFGGGGQRGKKRNWKKPSSQKRIVDHEREEQTASRGRKKENRLTNQAENTGIGVTKSLQGQEEQREESILKQKSNC